MKPCLRNAPPVKRNLNRQIKLDIAGSVSRKTRTEYKLNIINVIEKITV
jgi:hypothetical protein